MIVPIKDHDHEKLKNLFVREWGSSQMVSHGKVHQLDQLPGFLYIENNNIKGIITYEVSNNLCEIVSLDSFEENRGIGGQLLDQVIKLSVSKMLKLWLITTNDNTHALHFYQKRGFQMTQIYWHAVEEARKIKPEIPLKSDEGIPIQHEIELTYYP